MVRERGEAFRLGGNYKKVSVAWQCSWVGHGQTENTIALKSGSNVKPTQPGERGMLPATMTALFVLTVVVVATCKARHGSHNLVTGILPN